MKSIHIPRPPADLDTLRRQKKAMPKPAPAPARPPGYFTDLMRAPSKENPCGWSPRFEAQFTLDSRPDLSALSTAARMRNVAEGRERFSINTDKKLTGAAAVAKVRVR